MTGVNGERLFVRGVSIGGGKVKIVRLNQIDVDFTGEYSTLIISQTDRPGVVAHITKVLSEVIVESILHLCVCFGKKKVQKHLQL